MELRTPMVHYVTIISKASSFWSDEIVGKYYLRSPKLKAKVKEFIALSKSRDWSNKLY